MPTKLLCAAPGVPITITACGTPAVIAEGKEDGKAGTFEGRAYTGAVMKPNGWYRPLIIDLAGVKVPSQHRPMLRQHDHEQIVGHTEKVGVTTGAEGGIDCAGVFSGQEEHVKKVTDPARKGFKWQLSIGADPVRVESLEAGKTATVNGREVTGPLDIIRETKLGEISFVPLGADGDTSASVTATAAGRKGHPMFWQQQLKAARANGIAAAMKYSDDDIEKMDEKQAKAALKDCMKAEGDDDKPEEKKEKTESEDDKKDKAEAAGLLAIEAATRKGIQAAREAAAKEEERVAAIRASCAAFGGSDLMVEIEANGKKGRVALVSHAIRAGWTAERAELEARRQSRPAADVGLVPGGLAFSTTQPEITAQVLEAAVLQATRHELLLNNDDFYFEEIQGRQVRRVPQEIQAQVKKDWNQRYTDQVQQHAHDAFKGRIGLQKLIRAAFQANGIHRGLEMSSDVGIRSMLEIWDHTERRNRIEAEGSSSVSISNILANVMNKFALQGYLFVEQAWRQVAAIRNVPDFKPTKSINLLGDVMFKQIGATGELDNASLGDQAFANQISAYGRILTLPWQHIVNDDLGMLSGAPKKVGQGAGLALNDAFWLMVKAVVAGSVNADDGNPFFRTTSVVTDAAKRAGTAYLPNKLTGAGSVFGDAGLKAGRALFDNQIDPNGNPLGFDGMTPTLLHGPTLWRDVTAQAMAPNIVYGGASAANAANANVWAGSFKPVMSRYVENAKYVNSATAWFLMFNPAALPAFEVAFLNGVDTPAVLQAGPDYQFDRLGVSIRGTMPFGANVQNFRGVVYSQGS